MDLGFFHICPQCGAYIDPFEKCGCTAARKRRALEAAKRDQRQAERSGTAERKTYKNEAVFSFR